MTYSLIVYGRGSLVLLVVLLLLLFLFMERGEGVEVTISSFMVERIFSSNLLVS